MERERKNLNDLDENVVLRLAYVYTVEENAGKFSVLRLFPADRLLYDRTRNRLIYV